MDEFSSSRLGHTIEIFWFYDVKIGLYQMEDLDTIAVVYITLKHKK